MCPKARPKAKPEHEYSLTETAPKSYGMYLEDFGTETGSNQTGT